MENLTGSNTKLVFTAVSLLILVVVASCMREQKQPYCLREWIPYVSNTYQYLTDMEGFLDRASAILAKRGIFRFNLGVQRFYMVTGTKYTQEMLGPPVVVDPNLFHVLLMDKHWGMPKSELKRFEKDRTGRRKIPNPGTEAVSAHERHWYKHHQLYAEFLSSAKYTQCLADTFFRFFSETLETQSARTWTTVRLHDFLKTNMAKAAIKSLFGAKLLELNPDLISAYWQYDEVAGILAWGLPRCILPRPFEIRDRLHAMTRRMTECAWKNFDWEGPDGDSDWEPYFGSRFTRESAKWLRNAGFSDQTASGHTMATLFGVRQEVHQTFITDKAGRHSMNVHSLLGQPLLNSVITEALRMHISFNATREVKQDISIGSYRVAKGSIIQAPSQIAHYDEAVWGRAGHPASEFWAERHLSPIESTGQSDNDAKKFRYILKAQQTSFFPFGMGYALCPGRHFARRELTVAVAMIVERFDIEYVDWIKSNGSVSDRSAQNDMRYAGTAGMPPDRDMKIRWRRRW